MSPDDPVTITVKRQTLKNIGQMIPNAKCLKNEFLIAAVDILTAIDKALACDVSPGDVSFDMKEEDEEEPAYEPPR